MTSNAACFTHYYLLIHVLYSLFNAAHMKLGFKFHHTHPDHVMMTKWLPTTEPNNLPNFANHYIGKFWVA